jgi:hypothetical protein
MIVLHAICDYHGLDLIQEQIGEMEIVNDLSNKRRPEYGNYRVNYWGMLDGEKFRKELKVKDHKRSDGLWPLVGKALKDKENKELRKIITKLNKTLVDVRDKCKPKVDSPCDFGPLDVVAYMDKIINDTKKAMEKLNA